MSEVEVDSVMPEDVCSKLETFDESFDSSSSAF